MSNEEMTATEWRTYAERVIADIDAFDKRTAWRETEPEWWCEMMEVRRVLREQLDREIEA